MTPGPILYRWTDFSSNIIQVDYIKKEKKLHFSRGDYSKNTKKKNDDVSLAANDQSQSFPLVGIVMCIVHTKLLQEFHITSLILYPCIAATFLVQYDNESFQYVFFESNQTITECPALNNKSHLRQQRFIFLLKHFSQYL